MCIGQIGTHQEIPLKGSSPKRKKPHEVHDARENAEVLWRKSGNRRISNTSIVWSMNRITMIKTGV